RLAQRPQPWQAERVVRGTVGEGVARLPRARPAELRAAAASAGGVGAGERVGGVAVGAGREDVWAVEGGRQSLLPSRRAPDEQHAGPADARDEPVLRPGAAPARRARRLRAARAGVGTAVQLPTVAPGGGQGQRRLALPGRAPQPPPLPRRLAPEPPGGR